MIKNIKKLLSGAMIIPALVLGLGLFAQPAYAQFDKSISDGAGSAQGKDQAQCLFGNENQCSGDGVFKTITNVMLFIIGAVSVIMLIIGGLRYVVSGGDSTAVQNAKNTILYAIVGVIVAILAYAAVSFIISSFSGSTGAAAGTNV